jgi:hypothetical protein
MSHPATIVVAVVLTATAVTLSALIMGPAVILLNIGLIASFLAWLTTGGGRPFPNRLVGPIYLASIAVQTCHFIEEYAGRVYELLPPMFELSPLPPQRFVLFNLVWIAVFLAAAIGVFKRARLSLLAVWFMALLGGIGNAFFHGWLAIQAGGYAPGVITALVNLPFGITLVFLLARPKGQNSATTLRRTSH